MFDILGKINQNINHPAKSVNFSLSKVGTPNLELAKFFVETASPKKKVDFVTKQKPTEKNPP